MKTRKRALNDIAFRLKRIAQYAIQKDFWMVRWHWDYVIGDVRQLWNGRPRFS